VTTRELPFNVPYAALRELVRQSTEGWEQFISECLDKVHAAYAQKVVDLAYEHFGRFENLNPAIGHVLNFPLTSRHSETSPSNSSIIDEKMTDHKETTLGTLQLFMSFEEHPFTLNRDDLDMVRNDWFTKYRTERRLEVRS
jgi:hypothetical protein